jgi:hypothetical protein
MSSTRRADTPARYISIKASSTKLRRYRSMIAVSTPSAAPRRPSCTDCARGNRRAHRGEPRFAHSAAHCIGDSPPRARRHSMSPERSRVHPIEVAFNPLVINCDDIAQRTRWPFQWRPPSRCPGWHLATSVQIRGR